jgi:hypothetical protein
MATLTAEAPAAISADVVQAAIAQAERYAAQIRGLEDFVSDRQARNVRRAWRLFYWHTMEQFGPILARPMHDAYWKEYCK